MLTPTLHVLPIMRLQRSGTIINISSVAARENSYPLVTYKATKASMVAFTEQLALQNAPYGIRANCDAREHLADPLLLLDDFVQRRHFVPSTQSIGYWTLCVAVLDAEEIDRSWSISISQ
jgi:NAD(P)-dependent dehydrogenase (short-subunit alcohol dehydrogenase family)